MNKTQQKVNFSKTFDKQLRRSPLKIKIAFRKRLELFLKNSYHPLLNNHPLSGKLTGYRSINITGDWRAIYSIVNNTKGDVVIIFEMIGTHSQLYKN